MNKHKYNLVILGLLLILALLIAALYRGCVNVTENDNVDVYGRIKKLESDSAESAKEKEQYEQTIEFQNGQLSLSSEKIASLTIRLDSANDRITALLKRYKPVTPRVDTTVTTVPNEYIEDCAGCFTELAKGQQLVLKYKSEKTTQESLYKGQINTKNNRIKSLETSNMNMTRAYKSLIDSVGKINKTVEFRRTLYFKLGMLAINQTFPNSGGVGLIYQDKMKRMFGVGYYLSPFGSIYSADIAFPLSLKRRR